MLAVTPATLIVKKRNGQHVPFFDLRILRAIEHAWKAHLHIPHESALDPMVQAQAHAVADHVVGWCREQAVRSPVVFIEEIQDAVIHHLRALGHTAIAEGYAAYRQQHELTRFDTERLTIRKRDGRAVSFKPEKIALAIEQAFAAGEREGAPGAERSAGTALWPASGAASLSGSHGVPLSVTQQEAVLRVADRVVEHLRADEPLVRTIPIEDIQDLVEHTLMEQGHHEVAKRYIVYRRDRERLREQAPLQTAQTSPPAWTIRAADGTAGPLEAERLKRSIAEVCRGLEDRVSVEAILHRALTNGFDGMTTAQVTEALQLAARSLIEEEPAYRFVAARLLLRTLYAEVAGHPIRLEAMAEAYPAALAEAITAAVACGRLDPALQSFDLARLGRALRPERDLQFGYMGLQTLYDRYLLHHEGRRLEAPQIFWMRIAMGLALQEGTGKNDRAIEFYEVISSFRYVPSTPTLFNAGTRHPQLSSCFLTTVQDDLDHIFKSVRDNAMLSKWSGGLGNDWTPVRALGAHIQGTNGKSQGIIPFLKVANDTAIAVNQGGKRQGAVCAYLEVWHLDIEEFLELRKNTGDDRRRTHDMHTANWIPDLFMKRVLANGEWTLLSPQEAPDLHDLSGRAFEQRYEAYEVLARAGRLRQSKVVSAVELWRKMLGMLFETGHPWITFKDPSNIRSPQDHEGVVHSSNLCTEILLNTSQAETAVCNLGSVNFAAHTTPSGLDTERLAQTVRTAMRMLDNVIDLNYYPTPEAKTSNQRHRPVGLGIMGFQDALYLQGLSYASPQAVEFADASMEVIAYHALLASAALARERGAYPSFPGSKWARGLLPIDTLDLLRQERGGWLSVDTGQRLDWAPVREAIRAAGLRNSNTMAIAPTATIANIIGVTPSIEPTYKNLYVKSNLSGEFTAVNPYLVEEFQALGMWDRQMQDDLKYFDGLLAEIPRIPQALKDRYVTAFEIGYEWLIECASRRQKWLDMGQSLNLYVAEPSGKKLHTMYCMAWEKGLKTTYYLRSLGATRIEKATMDVNRYGDPLGQRGQAPAARPEVGAPTLAGQRAVPALSSAPGDAASCQLTAGESCEACQ